jgi:predicted Fe-Mo cluster-binding NifX family protein
MKKPADGFMTKLAAPARRALLGAGLTTLVKLAKSREVDVLKLHGMGPNAMGKLRAEMKKAELRFSRE